jgi:DNA-binding CsgD family transcriptional regulator/tetratricopeptide (TPR) repeat protein
MRLLEREESLGSLATYAREARRGDGRLVLVAGEAGVGKSALVERFQSELPGARWSWGACDGLFTPRPLGPLFDLAAQLGGELEALCRAGAAREELFGALLRQVSEPGTLDVVVVEDVHWADEASVDLLRFLGRRLADAPVLLVATYRDEDLAADDPLRAALGELVRQRPTRRIELAPLSADAVRRLAGSSGLDAAELYRLTGGNPFYVTEVLQAGMSEVPAAARDAVLARGARLGGKAREVLDAAALVGTRSELRLVESVTSCSPPALDEVLGSGLLAEDDTWLKFRHELTRLAVEQAIPAYRRRAIHARILAALQALGCEDDARMAFHAEAAGDGEAVLRYATSAGHLAAGLASHQEAAAQFQRALRFAAGADRATAAALYDDLAREAALIDRWQDAADANEHALALWRELGNQLREGAAMRRLSRTMWRLCRGPDSIAAAESALKILQPLGPSVELAWAYANFAGTRMVNNEHDEAIGLAKRAQAIAESLGVLEVLSDALNTEGCALVGKGGDGIGRLHQALQIAISSGLQEQAGRAFVNFDGIYCQQRRFAEAERSFAEGIAYCDDHDMATYATCLRGGRAIAWERTGRWDEAVTLGEQLLGIAASPVNRLIPLLSLGRIRARRDDSRAWESLDEAAATADGIAEPQYIIPARLARAEAYWLEGKQDLARSEAELADDVAGSGDAWERGEVAAWLRRTGSERSPRGQLAGPYQRQVEGDADQAAQLWTGLGCPYEAALALHDATDEAALREAVRIFTQLGASPAVQLTRQKMRRLGIRSIPAGPRTATRAHPLGLTRREREVLDLICAGHTNAEIAAKLFISVKTVDHHVSAVLAKLDAPNREIAASHAARLGLAGAAGR